MYKVFLRPIFFLFDPEKIHHFVFASLKFLFRVPGVPAIFRAFYQYKDPRLEVKLFGHTFSNPVGLAAGFDKDAKLFDELGQLGFGFVEIGTVTPLPQDGNPKKRMFRLKPDQALINRMGFNNEGAEAAAKRLARRKTKIIIGGNIGKNKVTPNENATDDYVKCFEALYPVVDFFVVNVSSPNTPGLRALQEKGPLTELLSTLKKLNATQAKPKSILLKIAPDLTNEQLDDIIEIVRETKIDGVVATNTTISRENLQTPSSDLQAIGAGGLSGAPLCKRSTEVIRYLSEKSNKAFPIIGVGGINSAQDAIEKLEAGASLVQVYTGFIYQGPGIAKKICRELIRRKSS